MPPVAPTIATSAPAAATGKSKADAALALGIVSIFLNVFYVPGILAIVWGSRERRTNGNARAGFICGIIGTVLSVFVTVLLVAVLAAAGSAVEKFDKVSSQLPDESGPAVTAARTAPTVAPAPATPHLSPLLFGTARPNLPAGDAGKVTIIQTSHALGESFYAGAYNVVVRNNTNKAVSVSVNGTARAGGALVGSGEDQGFEPQVLQPGEAGFGLVFFDNADSIPAGATFDFTATSSSSSSSVDYFPVTEANRARAAKSYDHDTVVGSFTNNTGENATLVDAEVLCFDGDRYTDSFSGHFSGDLPPGATGAFSATLYGTCPSFLVLARNIF
jgi:hypothetical protein